ncbi:hypothetical protein ANANG_G00255830, partial [Anguilla anguilla]
ELTDGELLIPQNVPAPTPPPHSGPTTYICSTDHTLQLESLLRSRETMMKSKRIFLSVLYLLLYSSFSTANLNPVVVTQVEKGINTNVKLLEGLGALGKLTVEEDAKTIQKVLEVFKKLGKMAYALGFVGALVGFILAFIPKKIPF